MTEQRSVLVTGANGYIGGAVAKAFSRAGWRTYGLVRRVSDARNLALDEITPIVGIEAARAAGASPFQIVTRAILPQVLPQLADVTIYRWEHNFRASTILGTVGAGGIGFELMTSLRIMNYQEVLAIMLVVLLMVTIVDQVGALLRRQLQ